MKPLEVVARHSLGGVFVNMAVGPLLGEGQPSVLSLLKVFGGITGVLGLDRIEAFRAS